MTQQSLEQKLSSGRNAFDVLYNNAGKPLPFPVASEYSNWRDEQEAWHNKVILQDMSYHMSDVYVEGPDCYRLLSDLAINSFANIGPMVAKQFVACNYDGQYIGDAILFCEEENKVSLVGKPGAANWVQFHAETGNYDVKIDRDERFVENPNRRLYRFQVQGPNADKLLEELNGGPLPEIKFFKMGRFNIGPFQTTALNHRMTGAPGYEFWGPFAEGDAIKALLMEAGEKYGLTQIGGLTYPVTAVESGWYGAPCSAIYSGEKMKAFREWLPADGFEGQASIGGSYVTNDISDLYVTPFDLGYGHMVKFDHDFIGREALEKIKAEGKYRRKVRLNWNAEDVGDVYQSYMRDGDRYKYMPMPHAYYSSYPADRLMDGDKLVGIADCPVYSVRSRGWISLALVDADSAVDGRELTVVWGEPDGGSAKPHVERHAQKAIRVDVDTKPIKRD